MESTRLAETALPAAADPREAIDALIADALEHGNRDATERLPIALKAYAVQHPAEARAYFQTLLDSKALDVQPACRAAVIQAQLALGFPYALEVVPDDLAWLREQTALRLKRPNVTRITAASFAAVSIAWSGFILSLNQGDSLLKAPFVVGALHGLSTLAVALLANPAQTRDARTRFRGLYRLLSRAGWLGPIFSVVPAIYALLRGERQWLVQGAFLGLIGLVCALPAMTTALVAGLAGKRLVPEDADEPPPRK